VIKAIAHLLRHETGGDPMRDLKWSHRAIRKIARQLHRLKIRVSASTVRRLLKQMGFSLRVNHRRLESGNKNPPSQRVRNRQFTYIDRQRKRFTVRANPVISVDAN
jgi:Rhodopirellula transposase DDE domain